MAVTPGWSHQGGVFSRDPRLACQDAPHLVVDPVPRRGRSLEQLGGQGPVHPGGAATTAAAVAILIAGVATLGHPSGRVLGLGGGRERLVLVVVGWVGRRLPLGLRLAAVHAGLVHAHLELPGPGEGHRAGAGAAVAVLEQGVVVAGVLVVTAGHLGGFDQRVDDQDQ